LKRDAPMGTGNDSANEDVVTSAREDFSCEHSTELACR
jgi:hypothetical protein